MIYLTPDGNRETCMIYDRFPGLDLYGTDPTQHQNCRLGSR